MVTCLLYVVLDGIKYEVLFFWIKLYQLKCKYNAHNAFRVLHFPTDTFPGSEFKLQ